MCRYTSTLLELNMRFAKFLCQASYIKNISHLNQINCYLPFVILWEIFLISVILHPLRQLILKGRLKSLGV